MATLEAVKAKKVSTPVGIAKLDKVKEDQIAKVGGKARNLVLLKKQGVNVPDAYVIDASVFCSVMASLGHGKLTGDDAESYLSSLLKQKNTESVQAVLDDVRDQIDDLAITSDLASALKKMYLDISVKGTKAIAVRSSALDEDGEDASFAGQYETVLNVKSESDLWSAIKTCWASALLYRSYMYRKQNNKPQKFNIALLVQTMVSSEVSGVAFTKNPMDPSSENTLVEAGWGLGEGIVDGQVTTDSFLIDPDSHQIVSSDIRYKLTACRGKSSSETEITMVPEELRNVSCITQDQLSLLTQQCQQIKRYFESDQDVEWAISDDHLYILQARPITTDVSTANAIVDLDPDEKDENVRKNTLWSMVDVGEATVGIMTPLGQSFMYYYRDNIHAKGIRACGAWDPGEPHRFLGFIHGRCYMNISNLAYTFSQVKMHADQSKLTFRYLNEDVDKDAYQSPFPVKETGVRSVLTTAYYLFEQWRGIRWKYARNKAFERRNKTYDHIRSLDFSKMTQDEFAKEIEIREQELLEGMINYFPFYLLSMAGHDMLTAASQQFLGNERLEDVLKTDMSELRTIDVTEDLWRVCVAMDEYEDVKAIVVENEPDKVKDVLQQHPQGVEFWNKYIEPLLRKHGVRGQPPEFDLSVERWVDNPSLLFSMAQNYIKNRFDLIQVAEEASDKRDQAKQRALAKLSSTKRWVMEKLINVYFTMAETRELTRLWMLTETWAMQKVIKEVTRRLVAKGLVQSASDIAFLDFRDLLAYGKGEVGDDHFSQEKINQKKQEHLFNTRVIDPPMSQVGPYDLSKRQILQSADSESINGLGTSPGYISGKARLIMDVHKQAGEFEPGEILVTHFTNAAWTPLFVTAAAVVTDLGSMLSHSSVVAREYGIPAVVNTKNATKRIKTGDEIIVDGNSGAVFIKPKD